MKNFTKNNRNFLPKIIMLSFVMLALSVSASAQRRTKMPKEFSIFGGGNYAFVYHQKVLSGVYGVSSNGFGADLGVGFTAFAGKHIGFHFGLGVGMNNVKTLVDSITFVSPNFANAPSLFGDEQPYDLYTNLSGYDEKQHTYFLTIPVLLQFQTLPQRSHRAGVGKSFYAMAGVKLNILLKKQYEVEVQELKNMAYFTQLENWAGTQRFAGLGRFVGNTANGRFKTIMPVFTFEAGMKWELSKKINLYTGAYFDCSLTDPTKNSRISVNKYTSAENLAELSLLDFYDKSFSMGVGIKLRLAFVKTPICFPCR
jgi:hypothetical protein